MTPESPVKLKRVSLGRVTLHPGRDSLCGACGCACAAAVQLGSCGGACVAHKTWKVYYLTLYRKSLPASGLSGNTRTSMEGEEASLSGLEKVRVWLIHAKVCDSDSVCPS